MKQEILIEILKEVRLIRKHLEELTQKNYKTGARFDFQR